MAEPFVKTREQVEEKKRFEKEVARKKQHMAEEKALSEFSYKAKCRDCDWELVWESSDTWRRGAPREHVNANEHTVDTYSTSHNVMLPGLREEEVGQEKPLDTDQWTAYCKQCQSYIGVHGGRFFNAAWKSHVKKTGHDITVKRNPRYKEDR